MPNSTRDIAMHGRLNMDQFQNRLNAVKDNQLRTTMASGSVPTGFAPIGVVAPKFENPDSMAELYQEKQWVFETAEAKRAEVARRKLLMKLPLILVGGYLLFK